MSVYEPRYYDFKLTSDAKIQPAITGKAFFAMVMVALVTITLYVQFVCSDWSKFDNIFTHNKTIKVKINIINALFICRTLTLLMFIQTISSSHCKFGAC